MHREWMIPTRTCIFNMSGKTRNSSYMNARGIPPTVLICPGGYPPWMGAYPPWPGGTYPGWGVPTLDGAYPPWAGDLPWLGVPTHLDLASVPPSLEVWTDRCLWKQYLPILWMWAVKILTRKSFCMTARGVLPAAYLVCSMCCLGGRGYYLS